jgi:hypothetical protein
LEHLEENYDFSDEKEKVHFRYGIIGVDDLQRDLRHWETLLVSSMMQRPIHKLIDDEKTQIWDLHLNKNLKSAVAFAALTTPSGV